MEDFLTTIGYYFFRTLIKILYFILYHPKKINKHYIPKQGRVIIACNHISTLDPCNIITSTPRQMFFLAKQELFKGPFSFFFKSTGCIPVNREAKSHSSTVSAIEKLNKDKIVAIFPEGRVKMEDDVVLGPLKNGFIKMAKETNSLVVPCAIVGKYRLFFNNLKIIYSEPIDITNLSYEDANKMLYDIIYNLIIENQN